MEVLDDHVPGLKVLHRETKMIKFNRNMLVNINKVLDDLQGNKDIIESGISEGDRKGGVAGTSDRKHGPVSDDNVIGRVKGELRKGMERRRVYWDLTSCAWTHRSP